MSYLSRLVVPITLLALPAALLFAWGRGLPGRGSASGEAGPAPIPWAATETNPAPGSPPRALPNQVVIDNFAFKPARLTVRAGTRVTWVNRDDVPHTATSTARPRLFDSGTLDTDDQFTHVFKAPGIYDYYCAVHPHMTGQIIVK